MSGSSESGAARSVREFPGESSGDPLVTIGMPVYNGAQFVEEAIRSLLAQIERDFVLVISDNCSTDATPDICSRLAAEDPRILYVRQEVNIGAMSNFEFLLDSARGTYFAWAAHDDIHAPEFLSEGVKQLEESPNAVGCVFGVALLDESSTPLLVEPARTGLASPNSAKRLRAVGMGGSQFYGLFRLSSLKRILNQSFLPDLPQAWDLFIYRLALYQPFAVSRRPLFGYRAIGYDLVQGDDGRWHPAKGLGPDGHLHARNPTQMAKYMLTYISEAPLSRRTKWLAWANVARRWIGGVRDGAAVKNAGRLKQCLSDRRYGLALMRAAAQSVLAPRLLVMGARNRVRSVAGRRM
jgi:glycosyltransferase involved in cell wall biosynthesis